MKEILTWLGILAIVLVFPMSYSTTTDSTPALNEPASSTISSSVAKNYVDSISNESMCNLSAEASTGVLKELYSFFMPLDNNSVSGWIHVYENSLPDGFTYDLWVNKYDPMTYTLVYAGTDQFIDTEQYISMEVDENFSSQMSEAIKAAKNITAMIEHKKERAKNPDAFGTVNNLFITGHSLGGYLASFVASELVDSSLGQTSRISTSDIGPNLTISNLKCITFGAPGMYYTGTFPAVHLTSWQERKVANDKQGKYDQYIVQYVNSLDPVGNLFPKLLQHIGVRVYLEVKKTAASTTMVFFMKLPPTYFVGFGASIYYHMPWVYIPLL